LREIYLNKYQETLNKTGRSRLPYISPSYGNIISILRKRSSNPTKRDLLNLIIASNLLISTADQLEQSKKGGDQTFSRSEVRRILESIEGSLKSGAGLEPLLTHLDPNLVAKITLEYIKLIPVKETDEKDINLFTKILESTEKEWKIPLNELYQRYAIPLEPNDLKNIVEKIKNKANEKIAVIGQDIIILANIEENLKEYFKKGKKLLTKFLDDLIEAAVTTLPGKIKSEILKTLITSLREIISGILP